MSRYRQSNEDRSQEEGPSTQRSPLKPHHTGKTVQFLRQKLRQCEAGHRLLDRDLPPLGTGLTALDELLPYPLPRGTFVEWLSDERGGGASTMAILLARHSMQISQAEHSPGHLVVIDSSGEFYPASAVSFGVSLAQTIVVKPTSTREEYWAIEQALRCTGVAAVIAWDQQTDERILRRCQLAAERGGGLGLLIRPFVARIHPCWGVARFRVQAIPGHERGRRLHVTLLSCRGGTGGGSVVLEIDDETGHVSHISSMALTAIRSRTSGDDVRNTGARRH